jgi:hypothetical protein
MQMPWIDLKIHSHVKTDTLNGHDSSYMASLMRPVYNQCNDESGMSVTSVWSILVFP